MPKPYLIRLMFAASAAVVPFAGAQTDATKVDPNMQVKKVAEKGVDWYDPRQKPFRLLGFKWIGQDKIYRRLPAKPRH